jgi:hypothetical protein
MNAFSFGRFVAEKVAAGPAGGLITSGSRPLQGPRPMGPKAPDRTGPGFLQSYGNVLDRWYNPWTKQQVTERGEHGLMRAGQTAMGVGAAAGAAAGGLAAAPTIAGMGTGTAATAGTGGVMAAQTPAGQNLMQRLPFAAQNAAHTYSSRIEPALNRVGYGPSDAAHDLYALGTGRVDAIKGPTWAAAGLKTPSVNTVTGAPSGWTTGLYPSFPRPGDVMKNLFPSAPQPFAQAKL